MDARVPILTINTAWITQAASKFHGLFNASLARPAKECIVFRRHQERSDRRDMVKAF